MPNYRYRPDYKKPKDNSSWIWYIFFFFIFGGGLGTILSFLMPILIVLGVFFFIYKMTTSSRKYETPYRSTITRSYRTNNYKSNYTNIRSASNDRFMNNIDKKLAVYFSHDSRLNVINDISLRLKGDSYININSLNVFVKDQYVSSFDVFKNRYPDIYNQMLKWLNDFDENARDYVEVKATETKLKKADDFITKINDLNTEIPDELITNGLYESSALLKQIADIEAKMPAKSEKLDKLYEYYLPMLINNLNQYKVLQSAQTSSSFNETKAKLQKNVMLINEAMKTITASLCEDDFTNLSADINTLEAVLKKDGLAGENRISVYKGGEGLDE